MNKPNHLSLFLYLSLLLPLLCLMVLCVGTVRLSFTEVWDSLMGQERDQAINYIVCQIRLPKMLTALFAGAGVATSGLLMQSLFRNPLADTSILGINSGAGVGVAIYTMAYTLFPVLAGMGGVVMSWGIVLSSCLGSLIVLLLISAVASRLKDMISVIIVGVMVGFLASSLISILQFFSEEETLKTYLLWAFGSVSGVSWAQIPYLVPPVLVGLICSLLLPKYMNALLLGERYAQSVGTPVRAVRIAMVVITGLVTGVITAFTGPIAFLGMAVPHFVRILFCSSDHRILLPATMLSGAALLLLCDLLTQISSNHILLPLNAITSLIGAPVVIMVVMRQRKN